VDEVAGGLILGLAGGDRSDEPGVPRGVERGRRDRPDPGIGRHGCDDRVERGRVGDVAEVDRDQQWPVETLTEPGGQQVVGPAVGGGRGIGAGVGLAEPHVEHRDRQRHEHCGRGDGTAPGVVGDPVGPAHPAAVPCALDGWGVAAGSWEHPVTGESEQCRQEGDGDEHGDRDDDRGRIAQRGDERDPGELEAEDGYHHGAAGDHHRLARRGVRLADRLDDVHPLGELVSMPAEDEQRVVDADPEPDHGPEPRRD